MLDRLIDDVAAVVLIETYWNVNLEEGVLLDFAPYSINRNILECKLPLVFKMSQCFTVLIETYWNVNKLSEIGTDREVQY